MVGSQAKVNEVFMQYYKKLYSSPPVVEREQIEQFVAAPGLNRVAPLQVEELEEPLHIGEIRADIHTMSRNKTPGME